MRISKVGMMDSHQKMKTLRKHTATVLESIVAYMEEEKQDGKKLLHIVFFDRFLGFSTVIVMGYLNLPSTHIFGLVHHAVESVMSDSHKSCIFVL